MTATHTRRTTSVTLYQGDDFEVLAELRREADAARRRSDEAEKQGAGRAGDDAADPDLLAVAERAEAEYNAFVDQAAERATEVRFRALRGKEFRALMAEHPPREGNADDAVYKVNIETFPVPLLMESIEEPELGAGARQDFIEDLEDGEFEIWWITAYWLNRSRGGDPKASRYSTTSTSSDET